MQIVFTDLQGEHVRGSLTGSGLVGVVEVLIVNANGRGFLVERNTRQEFIRKSGLVEEEGD